MEDLIEYVLHDDFFNSIKDEVTCSICMGIKIDPVMCSKCQNSFCEKCIKEWKKKSAKCPMKCDSPSYFKTRVIKNLVCKLKFKCKNGCDKIIPFENVIQHNEIECEKISQEEKYKKIINMPKIELKKKFKEIIKDIDINNENKEEILDKIIDLDFNKQEILKLYKKKYIPYNPQIQGNNDELVQQIYEELDEEYYVSGFIEENVVKNKILELNYDRERLVQWIEQIY